MSATLDLAAPPRRAIAFRARPLDILMLVPLALALGYLASPYVAVARLGYALRCGNGALVADAIDWQAVRAGLGAEVAGGDAVHEASATTADDDLPAFGQSFASHATENALATAITPASLDALMREARPGRGQGLLASLRAILGSSGFAGPGRFAVAVADGGGAPIKVELAFSARHGWRVENVRLPPAMLDGGEKRT